MTDSTRKMLTLGLAREFSKPRWSKFDITIADLNNAVDEIESAMHKHSCKIVTWSALGYKELAKTPKSARTKTHGQI